MVVVHKDVRESYNGWLTPPLIARTCEYGNECLSIPTFRPITFGGVLSRVTSTYKLRL